MFSARHEVAEIRSAARLPGCLCRCFYLIEVMLPNFWFAWDFNMPKCSILCYNFQALMDFWSLASSSIVFLTGEEGETKPLRSLWWTQWDGWVTLDSCCKPSSTPKPTNPEAIFSGRSSKLEPFDWGQRPWPSEGWPKHRICKNRRSGQDNKRGIQADPMFRVQKWFYGTNL